MCPEGTSAQGPRGDGGFPLRGRAFSRRDGRVWVDRALGPQSQSVPGPPWSPVALNTSGSSAPTSPPCLITGCGARLCRDGVGGRGLTCSGRAGCCPVPLRLGLVCVGFGGGQADQWRPPAWCGGPPLPMCARHHLWTHLSRSGLWTGPGLALLEAARPTLAIALRQSLTRGSRRDLCRTGTCLTVRRAGGWRVSDSALDCWMVARASPRLAVDRQAGLYVFGARVH